MENKIAVTTSHRGVAGLTDRALKISADLNIPFIARDKTDLNRLLKDRGLQGVIVVEKHRLLYKYSGGEFFFHPGMARLRINEIKNGKTDQMVNALDLRPGDNVIDCTLGLGSDSIVIAYVNKEGTVTGVESSPVICLIVREGLSEYNNDIDVDMKNAMRKIKVACSEHGMFLKKQLDNSADIVYFDPMFRTPVKQSCAMEAMRPLTNNLPLTKETIANALRVARRRVVIKEARNSTEFARLGISKICGGKHSHVAYGIIEKGGGCY
ncbi:MAG: class I SAM-dependent methyltransferase [Bacillota bacterium]